MAVKDGVGGLSKPGSNPPHFLILLVSIIYLLALLSISLSISPALADEAQAPDFFATSWDQRSFNLSDFMGSPVVLHITNIENPLCIECEKSLSGQVEELAALKALDTNVQIVTLNLRKNPYSIDGRELAQTWWEVNITWPWIEDLDPYPIGSKYLDYWTVRGGSSNPTIVLIDREGRIGPVYHVYRVGEGIEDGVQKAQSLLDDIQELNGTALMEEGEASPPAEQDARPEGATGIFSALWTRMENEVSRKDVTAFGMFLLGIFTSLAPCSIALMIAVFSYVMTVRRKDEYLRASASTSREGFMIGVAFTLGMAVVFFVLGLFISQIGVFFRDSKLFDLLAGVIMVLLGISSFKPLGEIIEP
ncbi:MAG TPA: cytochrome c biogenesis protein CcdA, partial [Methanothrix soehngenii]|nr:cytochrome c biogenesis protein CcdA [Methanothrix soehngenii]